MKEVTLGKYLAILSVVLLLGFPLGFANTHVVLQSMFQEIGLFTPNTPEFDREQMAAAGKIMAFSTLASIAGAILLLVSVLGLKYRTTWLYWAIVSVLIIYSTLFFFVIPVLSLLGLAGAVVLGLNKKRFGPLAA